jgi:GntR family transcriptional regulator/MocR family aminotransferase
MRTEYARRRGALLAALQRHVHLGTALAAPGGLHMVMRLADGVEEAACVRAARARDLAVAPLRAYYAGPPRMNGLVIGFAATPASMAAEAARRLDSAIRSVAPV